MSHRLDPLLRPASIAVFGATERLRSVGRYTVHNLLAGAYPGRLYAINPGRSKVLGVDCHAALADLPETVDHVVFCVSDRRIEFAVEQAIEHGARAVTIMSQLLLEDDPGLGERVQARVREAGLLACGPNGMGFYNCHDRVWLCGFDTRENHRRGGNVTLISHSGSGMSGIVDCEERIDFNLAVSTGQELNVGMADYMDFAIEQHAPRAIGLFMETAREPAALIAALEKANRHDIPVVAIKVGRTELSARLAQSHSGAIAGQDAAYQALFERYGVQRVDDIDAFVTALIMFAQPHPVATGGLVSLHDSGGERQLAIDLADAMGIPFARISDATRARLEARLDPGLPAVNPLDAWGAGGPDSDQIMEDCMAALLCDEDAALGAVIHARAPYSRIRPEYIDYLRAGHAASGKPVFLVSNHQGTGADGLAVEATREGLPVLDGLAPFLSGARCLMDWRDFRARPRQAQPLPDVVHALPLLGSRPGEAEAAAFLRAVGMPVNPCRRADTLQGALRAADELGYPVVLKTAREGVNHKTEHGGVHLGLDNAAAVRLAWDDLHSRLGPEVLVAPMVRAHGLEMVLGMTRDQQFGPLVMMGFGGTRLETLRDVVHAMPPFEPAFARHSLDRLQQRALFRHDRGHGQPDLDGFCRMAAHFSTLVAALGDAVAEIDINPIIVHAGGCIAVDALVIPTAGTQPSESRIAS